MKKFIFKVSVVGLFLMLIMAVMEIYVRSIPNEYSYKYNYLEHHIDSIQILAVGSSIGRSGIDPSYFMYNAFNAANVSQDIETDCAIIDKYLSRAKELNTVIFCLLPGSYCGRMCEGIENWRLRKYRIYMDMDLEWLPLSQRFEVSEMNTVFGQILKVLRGVQTVECFERGMGKDSVVETEVVKLSQAIEISKLHNEAYNPSNYEIIVPKLQSTIENLTKVGIDVYMVLLPVYYTYADRIDNKMLYECDSISREIASHSDRIHYLNMFTDTAFSTGDFRNSNHLSQRGAKELSKKLNEIIINHAK